MSTATPAVTPASFSTFGELLRYLRVRALLSQRELAIAVGYSEAQISRLEQNQRRPNASAILARFVPALGLANEPQWATRLVALAQADDEQPGVRTAEPEPPTAEVNPTTELLTRPSNAAEGLLTTKLFAPGIRRTAVSRLRLLERLAHLADVPLTVIIAPAGFGKTTLLAEWLAALPRSPAPDAVRSAWLSLDVGENDPGTFFRYLIAACRQLAPGAGATTLAMLQAPQLPPLSSLLLPLLNDLATLHDTTILALDDYHLITNPVIHEAMAFLIDKLPPFVHIAIAARSDPPLPLARLRARGQLVELRAEELRFTTAEAEIFLRDTMALAVSKADVSALEARTEGWIVGLQLAALALRDHGDPTRFVAAFSGSNRYLIDYLAEEVLNRLPPHLRTFVLQTSVLERMCGEVCDAVLGIAPTRASADSYSQLILSELERMNLFMIPLDNERRWYRYHHLFRDVLAHRLRHGVSSAELDMLHRRAGAWFEAHGFFGEAIQHAFAAADVQHAAGLIEQQIEPLQKRGEHITLHRWFQQLPSDVFERYPYLCLAQAGNLILAHQLEEAEQAVQQAEIALQSTEAGRVLPGQLLLIRARIAQRHNQFDQALELARQSLALLPVQNLMLRGQAMMTLGVAAYWCGMDQTAIESFAESARLATLAGDIYYALSAIINQAEMLTEHARLREAMHTLQHGLQLARNANVDRLPVMSRFYDQLGLLLHEQYELAEAAPLMAQAIERADLGADPYNRMRCRVRAARLHISLGNLPAVQMLLDAADEIVRQHQLPYLSTVDLVACRVVYNLAHGDLRQAIAWARRSGLSADDELTTVQYPLQFTFAHVLIIAGDLRAARRLLTRMIAWVAPIGRAYVQFELLVLAALAARADHDFAAAFDLLQQALDLAEPEGFVRIFADAGAPMAALLHQARTQGIHPAYCTWLLGAFVPEVAGASATHTDQTAVFADAPPPPASSVLDEPLTPREQEVLQLLANGSSNQQIGDTLHITVGTVKRHLNSLFGKLHVGNRIEAVARAHELGLVR